MVATSSATSGITVGDLGSTFGGGPIACAAGIATLEVFDREQVFENVRTVSAMIRRWAHDRLPAQGLGLLLGLRCPRPAAAVQKSLFARHVLTGTASDPAILRLLPPLTFSRDEAALLLARLQEALDEA
jgi:acetylornithine/succinyldiaminopimelate/putrescine aminotransferase